MDDSRDNLDGGRGADRRNWIRVKAEAYASLEVEGLQNNDQGFAVVLDVSMRGIRVRTPQPPAPSQKVIIRVGVGEELYLIRAIVARVNARDDGTYDVGLVYSTINELKVKFIEAFLSENPIA